MDICSPSKPIDIIHGPRPPALPGRYVDALFDYHSTFTGQRTLSPRWKRMPGAPLNLTQTVSSFLVTITASLTVP